MAAEKSVFGGKTYFRTIGDFLRRRQKDNESKPLYQEALTANPKDAHLLEGRSWARINTLDFRGALQDIGKALEICPGQLDYLAQESHIKYLDCDFEDAYVMNVRGLAKRIQPPWFEHGTKACNETIENCLGERAGHPLRDYYDIIRTIAMKRAYDLLKGFQYTTRHKRRKKRKIDTTVIDKVFKSLVLTKQQSKTSLKSCKGSIIESLNEKINDAELFKPTKKSEFQPLQKCTTNIDNLLSEKYLENMYLDKLFLKSLKYDERIMSPNYAGTLKIKKMVKNGYKDITTRQRILRTRKPFYTIKYNEGQIREAVKNRDKEDLKKVQEIVKTNIEKYLKELRQARDKHLTEECIHLADKIKTYIDKTTLKIVPKKENYLRQMYELIGRVHLEKFRINHSASEENKVKRVQFLFGKSLSREPSQDSVIKNSKPRFMDVKEEIRRVEKRIRKASTPLETTWLFFELGRHNISLKKYDLARVYGRKCINMAKAIKNDIWATNGSLLICIAHIQQGKRNEAKNELLRTKILAKQLKTNKTLEFIDKTLSVIQQLEVEETMGAKIIQMREKAILKTIMLPKVKTEVSHLLAKMSAIPDNRRLAIMPGLAVSSAFADQSIKKQLKLRQSILPTTNNDFREKVKAIQVYKDIF